MESSNTQTEAASPLENILLKLLLGIFFCAILGIGIVFVSHTISFPKSQPDTLLNPLSQISPSPTPIANTFQMLLANACKKATDQDTYNISFDTLPLTLNTTVLPLANDTAAMCTGTETEKYVTITTKNGAIFYLYDANVSNLNAFGNSLFHPSLEPVILDSQNNITLTMFLRRTPGSTVGNEPVVIRGTKSLRLSTGETIYLTTDTIAVPGNDQLLQQILTPFEISTSQGKDVDPSKETEYEDAIKKIFFGNAPLINTPTQVPAIVTALLNSFSAK